MNSTRDKSGITTASASDTDTPSLATVYRTS